MSNASLKTANGLELPAAPPERRPLLAINWKSAIIAACVVFTLYVAVIPLGFLLWESFFTPHTATKAAEFTLRNYFTAYSSPETFRLFWNSVQFAIGVAAFAFIVGTTLAWINERTNTPFKSAFYALSLIPLVIPGILFTVAWILLGSPKIGIVNLALQHGEKHASFGDTGYQGEHKRAETAGPTWHVAMHTGQRSKLNSFIEPDLAAERIEQMKASVRAKVKHLFCILKQQFGFTKVRYRGLAKSTSQIVTLFPLSNLWMAQRRLIGAEG